MKNLNLQLRGGRNNPAFQDFGQLNNDILLVTEPEITLIEGDGITFSDDIDVFNDSPGPLTFRAVLVDPELGEIVISQAFVPASTAASLNSGGVIPAPGQRYVLRTSGGALTNVHANILIIQLRKNRFYLLEVRTVAQLVELVDIDPGNSLAGVAIEAFNFGTDGTMNLGAFVVSDDGFEVSKGGTAIAANGVTNLGSFSASAPQKLKSTLNHLPTDGTLKLMFSGIYADKPDLPA